MSTSSCDDGVTDGKSGKQRKFADFFKAVGNAGSCFTRMLLRGWVDIHWYERTCNADMMLMCILFSLNNSAGSVVLDGSFEAMGWPCLEREDNGMGTSIWRFAEVDVAVGVYSQTW